MHTDSSLSRNIMKSKELAEFLVNNMRNLNKKRQLTNTSLSFQSGLNNFAAIHNCDIIDIVVDENDVFRAKVIDTVDYNAKEWWVKLPKDLQDGGAIENYYIIAEIALPIDYLINC